MEAAEVDEDWLVVLVGDLFVDDDAAGLAGVWRGGVEEVGAAVGAVMVCYPFLISDDRRSQASVSPYTSAVMGPIPLTLPVRCDAPRTVVDQIPEAPPPAVRGSLTAVTDRSPLSSRRQREK